MTLAVPRTQTSVGSRQNATIGRAMTPTNEPTISSASHEIGKPSGTMNRCGKRLTRKPTPRERRGDDIAEERRVDRRLEADQIRTVAMQPVQRPGNPKRRSRAPTTALSVSISGCDALQAPDLRELTLSDVSLTPQRRPQRSCRRRRNLGRPGLRLGAPAVGRRGTSVAGGTCRRAPL
jgi:hypothetical protein